MSDLFKRTRYNHVPRNVNKVHAEMHKTANLNQRIAVLLTKNVGTMWCAYLFAAIGIGSLIGVFTNNVFLALLFGSISSYFLQLILLPILSVGQNVLGKHAELLAEEQYNTTLKTYHDLEQVMQHLAVQDSELVKQTKMLIQLLQSHSFVINQLIDARQKQDGVMLTNPIAGLVFDQEKAQQDESA